LCIFTSKTSLNIRYHWTSPLILATHFGVVLTEGFGQRVITEREVRFCGSRSLNIRQVRFHPLFRISLGCHFGDQYDARKFGSKISLFRNGIVNAIWQDQKHFRIQIRIPRTLSPESSVLSPSHGEFHRWAPLSVSSLTPNFC